MNIDKVRGSNGFMRTVASIVLVTYSTIVLSPSVQAMQQAEMQAQARDQAVQAQRSNFGKALDSARDELRVLAGPADRTARKPDQEQRRAAKESLRTWRAETRALVSQVRSELASTQELIERKHLPDVIRQRHAEAAAKFETEVAAFDREIDEALAATDPTQEQQKAQAALRRLDRTQLGRSQQQFDPNNLPNGVLKPDRTRAPKTTTEQFQAALLLDNPTARFAQAGGFDFSQLPDANNPSYLEASSEIVLTPDVIAKADELHRNPVEIYNWVRNNVEWLPTWGALQDSSHTLSSLRGNALDIASLTIALLRASGIPARYVHGTIDVPEDKFRNWTGGFQQIDAAMDFASAAGIPLGAVTSGGRITKIRMEHVWVEAAIDFNPSRGAKNRSADSWIALDPSYKQSTILPGLDPMQISGIDQQQLANRFLASGSFDVAEGWATGFDGSILQAAHVQARESVFDYVDENLPGATVKEVLGGRRIVSQSTPVLAAGIPNRVVAVGARLAKLPPSLQQQITFAFGKDIEGEPIDPITVPWAQLNNKQVTLSFRPASQADEDALRALVPPNVTDMSQLPTSIPAYLFRVVPELKVDGTVILQGASMVLGSELNFVFNPRFVGSGVRPFSYSLPAGSYLAVAVIGGSLSPAIAQQVKTRFDAARAALQNPGSPEAGALGREGTIGNVFHAGLLAYYAHYLATGHSFGLQGGGHHNLAAGLGTYGNEPNVDYFFGVPRALKPGGPSMNIPIVNIVRHDSLDPNHTRALTSQLGIMSSAFEYLVPEQMFVNDANPGQAVSTVKAFMLASAAGQRIYRITPQNQGTVLGLIHHDTQTMDEISTALSAGKEVITHSSPISVPGWSGAGYIIQDADTGAGAYKISGGANGGVLVLLGALLTIFGLFFLPALGGILMLTYGLHFLYVGTLISMFVGDFDFRAFADGAAAVFTVIRFLAALFGFFASAAVAVPATGVVMLVMLGLAAIWTVWKLFLTHEPAVLRAPRVRVA